MGFDYIVIDCPSFFFRPPNRVTISKNTHFVSH